MCVCVPARRQCATQASCCGTVSSCWGAVLVLWPGGECLWSWVLCDRHSTTDAAQHGDGFADVMYFNAMPGWNIDIKSSGGTPPLPK